MKITKPIINKEQLESLKSDIKLINKCVVSEINANKAAKFPVTKSQNVYSRELGFSSFSEMSLLSKPLSEHPDFSIDGYLSTSSLLNIYRNINVSDGLADKVTIDHINNALIEFKKVKYALKEPHIELSLLHEIINESQYCEHTYTKKCGFPTEFNVETTSEFFDLRQMGDHIIVANEIEKKCYTVTEFDHMYTNEKVFKIVIGRWWNLGSSPFSTGQN
jgi:hypothetical protein